MKEVVGNTLDSRDEARKLFAYIVQEYEQGVSPVFDFEGIVFMSRSFADEFHKLKMQWATLYHVTATIENADIQIVEILQAVGKTQTTRTAGATPRTILSLTNIDQLSDYLLSV